MFAQPKLISIMVLSFVVTFPVRSLGQAVEEGSQPTTEQMEAWMEAAAPRAEHARLQTMTGEWRITYRVFMDAASPPEVTQGTVTRRMILGGRFLEENLESDVMGQPFRGLGVIGYDNVTGKYVSTWLDSMSTGISYAEGHPSSDGDEIIFEGEYPDPVTGGTQEFKWVLDREDPDQEVLTYFQIRNGEEVKVSEIVYEKLGSGGGGDPCYAPKCKCPDGSCEVSCCG